MEERNDKKNHPPEATIAPGIGESDELNRPATREELERHDTTTVTRVWLDEAEPS